MDVSLYAFVLCPALPLPLMSPPAPFPPPSSSSSCPPPCLLFPPSSSSSPSVSTSAPPSSSSFCSCCDGLILLLVSPLGLMRLSVRLYGVAIAASRPTSLDTGPNDSSLVAHLMQLDYGVTNIAHVHTSCHHAQAAYVEWLIVGPITSCCLLMTCSVSACCPRTWYRLVFTCLSILTSLLTFGVTFFLLFPRARRVCKGLAHIHLICVTGAGPDCD